MSIGERGKRCDDVAFPAFSPRSTRRGGPGYGSVGYVAVSGMDRAVGHAEFGRARVPQVNIGSAIVAERLDRHFALLTQSAPATSPAARETIELMNGLTGLDVHKAPERRFARLSMLAPLRRLRRLIGR